MTTLAFARDQLEVRRLMAVTGSEAIVLGLLEQPPWLLELPVGGAVRRWEEVGITTLGISFGSTARFREIDDALRGALAEGFEPGGARIADSAVRLALIMREYGAWFAPFHMLDEAFRAIRPGAVALAERGDLAGRLACALADAYDIPLLVV